MKRNKIRPFSTVRDKKEGGKLADGTYRVGYLPNISPSELLKCFGLPTFTPEDSGDGKVHVEWVVKFKDPDNGEYNVFTVYDWRFNFNPFELPEERWRFNIGGKDTSINEVQNFIDSVTEYASY